MRISCAMFVLLAAGLSSAPAVPAQPRAEVPAESVLLEAERIAVEPYVVMMDFDFAGPELSERQRAQVRRETRRLLEARYGGAWRLEFGGPASPTGDGEPPTGDVAIHCEVRPTASRGYRVAVSVTRARMAEPREPARFEAAVLDLVPPLIADEIDAQFDPDVLVRSVDGETIEAVVRAGALVDAEGPQALLAPGDLLAPSIEFQERDGSVRLVRPIDWTYLKVTSVEGLRLRADVVSTFRNPIPERLRRAAVVARRVTALHSQSRLTIREDIPFSDLLRGAQVRVLDRLPQEGEEEPSVQRFLTDRRGLMTIPNTSGDAISWVEVQNGTRLLARVPFLVGSIRHRELLVPGDTSRLYTEGELAAIEADLVEAISRKSVLMARARKLAQIADWDSTDAILEALDDLPSEREMKSRINAVRVQGVRMAERRGETSAHRRIERMCRDLNRTVEQFLDTDSVQLLREEIAELKRAATS